MVCRTLFHSSSVHEIPTAADVNTITGARVAFTKVMVITRTVRAQKEVEIMMMRSAVLMAFEICEVALWKGNELVRQDARLTLTNISDKVEVWQIVK
jgi:hypothetical protein